MITDLSGNGIFAFSDPAGAKACLGLNEMLNELKVTGKRILYSDKQYPFYNQFTADVKIISHDQVKEIAENSSADWIFTGTSHPDSSKCFELLWLKNSRAKRFSFIDHWTNFALRFQFGSETVLPDTILVLDEEAKSLAIKDGLPEEKIRVFENPYLTWLSTYAKPSMDKAAFRKACGIPAEQKVLVYAPDPVSLRNKTGKNELDVLRELLAYEKRNFFLLLKLHPLQPAEAIKEMVAGNRDVKILDDAFLLPQDIFANADGILGFYSNYLLEASTISRCIIRYILNNEDPLHNRIESSDVHNKEELYLTLQEHYA